MATGILLAWAALLAVWLAAVAAAAPAVAPAATTLTRLRARLGGGAAFVAAAGVTGTACALEVTAIDVACVLLAGLLGGVVGSGALVAGRVVTAIATDGGVVGCGVGVGCTGGSVDDSGVRIVSLPCGASVS